MIALLHNYVIKLSGEAIMALAEFWYYKNQDKKVRAKNLLADFTRHVVSITQDPLHSAPKCFYSTMVNLIEDPPIKNMILKEMLSFLS